MSARGKLSKTKDKFHISYLRVLQSLSVSNYLLTTCCAGTREPLTLATFKEMDCGTFSGFSGIMPMFNCIISLSVFGKRQDEW